MMATATTHNVPTRKSGSRKLVNTRSLQMMVSSGVVRPADCSLPTVLNRRELVAPAVTGKIQPRDVSPAQGWFMRLLVRRKIAASV
jgi:hypothetical protein